MSKRAEEAALKAYPNVEQPVWDESYPKTLFVRHTERNAFIKGYEQAEKDLGWHSVKDSLPPIDEEVAVLTNDFHGNIIRGAHRICYAHRPNPNGWNGKNVDTGETTHYDVITYDGWNIPGVTHWMYLPKLED